MITAIVFLTSLLISLFSVALIRTLALRYKIGSLPSARKIHKGFVPVLGGVGIFVGLLAGIGAALLLGLIDFDHILQVKYFFIGLFVVVLTGLLDDIKGLNSAQKFAGEFIAAIALVVGGCVIAAFHSPDGTVLNLGWFAYPFSVLWIVFVINAVNLMDGLDGLAGGISLIALIAFLIIATLTGNAFLIILALAAAGGVLGFLKYNRHPASIFMGDVGSLQLGFLLAFFSIESLRIAGSNQIYFLASLVILGVPITDTLISFFRRLGGGEHPFKADQEHVHHRIFNLGLSHSQTVNLLYALGFFYSITAVFMVLYDEVAGLPLFIIAFVFSIYWAWRLGYLETRKFLSFGLQGQETSTSVLPPFHWNRVWHQVIVLLADLVAVNLALYLTYWFKFESGVLHPEISRSIEDLLTTPVFLLFTLGWLLLFWLNGLYRMSWDVSRFDKFMRVSKVITFGIIFIGLITTDFNQLLTRSQVSSLVFYWLAMVVLVNGFRLLIIMVEKRLHIFEYSFKNSLIVGATRKARNVIRDIESNPHLLFKIVGIVERNGRLSAKEKDKDSFEGYPVLGGYDDLSTLIQNHKIEEIIVALGKTSRNDLMNIIGICDRLQVAVKTFPELNEIVTGKSPNLAGHSLVRIFPDRMVTWQWLVKRGVDIISSILVLPVLIGMAIPVRFKFRDGVFVKQPIVGRNGQIFDMYLFRITDAQPTDHFDYRDRIEDGRSDLTKKKLTPLGRFLYEKNLYKLPQILNILKGEMSLVGPRPESIEWYKENGNRFHFLHRRTMVRPGITGLAQVKYRYERSQRLIQEKIKFDIYYVENISISLDLRIILRSALLFFFKKKPDQ